MVVHPGLPIVQSGYLLYIAQPKPKTLYSTGMQAYKFLKNIGLPGFRHSIAVVFDFQGQPLWPTYGFHPNNRRLPTVFQGIVKKVGQGIRQMAGISSQKTIGPNKRPLLKG